MKTSYPDPHKATEKTGNKAKYLILNFIRINFVKKTSMPNPVISLGYIKCSLSSSRPVQIPSNSIWYNCQKIYSWLRKLKSYWESENRPHLFRWSTIPIIYKFFKDLMYESLSLQFFRTTIGIQSPDAFDKSRFVITVLTILRITEI